MMLVSVVAVAQKKYTISGYAKDVQNGETLIGATITVKGNSKGIASNQYGFYSITLLEGNYELVCSYVTDDPVFGYMAPLELNNFFKPVCLMAGKKHQGNE